MVSQLGPFHFGSAREPYLLIIPVSLEVYYGKGLRYIDGTYYLVRL